MPNGDIRSQVRDYHDALLRAAGPTPAGVGWNSAASQELRFSQLLRCLPLTENQTVLDYGCGYGALYDFLRGHGIHAAYVGFDISAAMIAEAKRLHPPHSRCTFTSLPDELAGADYVVASGIFNVRQTTGDKEWRSYIEEEVTRMAELATVGVAFNVLSAYSDLEKQEDYLYYADPLFWFDFCKRHVGRAVVLLHDYPAYEFTLFVTKGW